KLAERSRRAQAYLTWSVDVHSSLSAVHGRQLRRAALRIVEHFRMTDRSDPVAMTESLSALGGRELHLDVRESSRRYRCSVRRSTGATRRSCVSAWAASAIRERRSWLSSGRSGSDGRSSATSPSTRIRPRAVIRRWGCAL